MSPLPKAQEKKRSAVAMWRRIRPLIRKKRKLTPVLSVSRLQEVTWKHSIGKFFLRGRRGAGSIRHDCSVRQACISRPRRSRTTRAVERQLLLRVSITNSGKSRRSDMARWRRERRRRKMAHVSIANTTWVVSADASPVDGSQWRAMRLREV